MKNAVRAFMQEWGYNNFTEFTTSTFGYMKPKILALSGGLGVAAVKFEEFIGLTPIVYIAFALILIMEFFTGIKASLKEGTPIDSNKWQRVILKLIIYTLVIGVINIFKDHFVIPEIMGFEINIYAWIFYTVINLVVVQMILSVLENLSRLGFEETSAIFKVIKQKLNKWFKLDVNERGNNEEE